jgi:hypothetical protein
MLERLLADVTPEVARLLDGSLSGRELSRGDALRPTSRAARTTVTMSPS